MSTGLRLASAWSSLLATSRTCPTGRSSWWQRWWRSRRVRRQRLLSACHRHLLSHACPSRPAGRHSAAGQHGALIPGAHLLAPACRRLWQPAAAGHGRQHERSGSSHTQQMVGAVAAARAAACLTGRAGMWRMHTRLGWRAAPWGGVPAFPRPAPCAAPRRAPTLHCSDARAALPCPASAGAWSSPLPTP